jgi:hypothetical protein
MSDTTKTQDQTFPLFPKLPKEIRLMIWKLTLPGPRTVHLQQRKLKTTIGEWEDQSGLSWPVFPEEHENRGENGEPNSAQRWFHRRVMRKAIQRALGMPYPHKKSSIYREASLLGLHSQSPPLETPAVCREAYKFAGYIKMFSTLGSVAETWFNPQIDTLYIHVDNFGVYDFLTCGYDIFDPFPVTDGENLGSVKKLALYWDVIVEPMMSRDPEIWSSIPSHVIALLELFSGLEELTIVLKHHEEDSEKGQGQEISFWNPVDLDRMFATMNSLISDPLFIATCEVAWLNTWKEDLEEIWLKKYKDRFEEGKEVGLPSIVQKIAVTEGVRKRYYDGFRKLGEKCLSRGR